MLSGKCDRCTDAQKCIHLIPAHVVAFFNQPADYIIDISLNEVYPSEGSTWR